LVLRRPGERVRPQQLWMLAAGAGSPATLASDNAADRRAVVVQDPEAGDHRHSPARRPQAQAEVEVLAVEAETLVEDAGVPERGPPHGQGGAGHPVDLQGPAGRTAGRRPQPAIEGEPAEA